MPPQQPMTPQQPSAPQQPMTPQQPSAPQQPTQPNVTSNPPTGPTYTPQAASSIEAASSDYPVKIIAPLPDGQSRGLAFVGLIGLRPLLLIPHYVVIIALSFVVGIVMFINYLIILFTGKSSPGMHSFMVGVARWSLRISAYSYGITDKYPPFRLSD
jgi:hypothetical protein